MGLRFIAAAALVVIVVFLVRGWMRRRADAARHPARPALKRTVRCSRCGSFVARDAAVERDGLLYCSTRHATEETDQDAGR